MKVDKGTFIYKVDDHAGEMYFIASGSADMYCKKIVVATVPEGGYVGIQVLYRQSHGFGCKARTDCKLYAWRRSDMQSVFEDFPLMYEKLVTIAKERSEKFRKNYNMILKNGRRGNIFNAGPSKVFFNYYYNF